MRNTKKLLVCCTASLVVGVSIGSSWVYIATARVWQALEDLIETVRGRSKRFMYDEEQMAAFFDRAELNFFRSFGPLLERPWRSDIRLYYQGVPPMTRDPSHDAHAANGPEGWFVKIHAY